MISQKGILVDGKAPRILIVDDDINNQHFLASHLAQLEYKIEYAGSSGEAINLLYDFNPSLVLLDVVMNGMDGFEVCRHIKFQGELGYIPIILVTSLDRRVDLMRGLEAGADDFLSKPINGTTLLTRVNSLLRVKKHYNDLQRALSLQRALAEALKHVQQNQIKILKEQSQFMFSRGNLTFEDEKSIKYIAKNIHGLDVALNRLRTECAQYAESIIESEPQTNDSIIVRRQTARLNRAKTTELYQD